MADAEKRWMTRSQDFGAPSSVIERDTHRCHKGTPAKNAAKVVVDCFHHASWRVVFHTAMVKEKFCQCCKQCSSSPVTGAIGNPEQDPTVFHLQPAIDIAAYLDHWTVTGCNLPARQHQRLLRN